MTMCNLSREWARTPIHHSEIEPGPGGLASVQPGLEGRTPEQSCEGMKRGQEPCPGYYMLCLFLEGLISSATLSDWLRYLPCVPGTQEL